MGQPSEPAGTTDDPRWVPAGAWSRELTLRDGTRVLLRQIRAQDRDRLAEGLRQLSPASRYLRFHADVEQLSDEQLDHLTDVDHLDHEAIVALDLDDLSVPGIGVARYLRDPYERSVAEAAVTVADAYHGRGAGTVLLGALSARARANGVEVFRNYVLDDNEAMLQVFDALGAVRERETDRLWRVDLPVPERDAELPDTPAGRAFLTFARDGFRLSSLIPPVWWGRRADSGVAEGIAAELATLESELSDWLADRERRGPTWPQADDDADTGG